MKKVYYRELLPGMVTAEPVYSLNRKQVLIDAGVELSDRSIDQITNWDIPYVMIAEEGEQLLIEESPPPEPDLSVLPEQMAKKTLSFIHNFEAAIVQVSALLEDARADKVIDITAFREVAKQVEKYLIQPSEAINRMLFRMPVKSAGNYLAYHSVAVGALSGMLAVWMDLPPSSIADVVLAGVLHDVGKTQIPRSLIVDSSSHQDLAKQHVPFAVKLLRDIPGLAPDVLSAVLQHHEVRDGSGYPRALSGDQIHSYARIVQVANRLCQMVADSPRLNPFILVETIKGDMFAKLDPTTCDTFVRRFNDYLMNNPVQLSDGRKAKVVFLPSVNPTSPVLQTTDNEFIDLTKNKNIKIEGLTF
ncbi:MAG: HD domain-containing phosphohydrolase [Negativicutes bacterium]|nr:HD domain-containing phosphohydrolase [Negativicutes bacterium]MDR3590280.1 HD domain-containing phosphohydrolase [Negativicutes bacterium]